MTSPALMRDEIAAEVQRITAELGREIGKTGPIRARLLEVFGYWVALARMTGGRADWTEVIEDAFPWPDESEIEKACKAARQRLGLHERK